MICDARGSASESEAGVRGSLGWVANPLILRVSRVKIERDLNVIEVVFFQRMIKKYREYLPKTYRGAISIIRLIEHFKDQGFSVPRVLKKMLFLRAFLYK